MGVRDAGEAQASARGGWRSCCPAVLCRAAERASCSHMPALVSGQTAMWAAVSSFVVEQKVRSHLDVKGLGPT